MNADAGMREGARDLLRLAKIWRQPVVGALFIEARDSSFQIAFVMIVVDLAGTIGFRDLMGRAVPGERAKGIELTLTEARALAA